MGRGRAKAKQTKVARELKYSAGHLDPERLKAELASGSPFPTASTSSSDEDEEFEDPYADEFDDEDDDAGR
ncbi:MAG TPA: DUF3073 domain-containing protein [Mycobacteriales bacterium]|nr:DUF3073 domain-containing protein [Mycobacteriales bacterium]